MTKAKQLDNVEMEIAKVEKARSGLKRIINKLLKEKGELDFQYNYLILERHHLKYD